MWSWYRLEGQQSQYLSHICLYTNIHRNIYLISLGWTRNLIVYALVCVRFVRVHWRDVELYFYRCSFDNDSAFTETDIMKKFWQNCLLWLHWNFRIWGYVLYVKHISCAITNCGQHQRAIPPPFSIVLEDLLGVNITRKLISLTLDLFFKFLLSQVTFLILFSIDFLLLQVGF